jgi:ABC-type dipeptide/oligopeptide/nickel transport system permease component
VFRYLVRRVLFADHHGITVFATLAIVFNLAVDLAYPWVDPRIRLS